MKNSNKSMHIKTILAVSVTILIVFLAIFMIKGFDSQEEISITPPTDMDDSKEEISIAPSTDMDDSKGEITIIRHTAMVDSNDTRSHYYIDLLNLALSKTEDSWGEYSLQGSTQMNQSQAIDNLSKNLWIDVLWTMTSIEREEVLLPIRIPLLKGLLGHRIFIVRSADKEIFSEIDTLEELKRYSAGQGHDWPDTAILKANGFNVTTSSTYQGLFEMLQLGRFDFFPRAVNEPWDEVIRHEDKDLVVETNIMLYYPAPSYFFVNNENVDLAARLQQGLEIAIEDGSFEELFRTHPANIPIFEQANLTGRKLFMLENPLLPPLTPLDVTKYWYFPNQSD